VSGAQDVTVVVPLYNGRHLIADCLWSIPDGAEIIVVDDGSTDGAPQLVEELFPHVVLLRNERNLGFGATCNRGLAAGRRPIRVVLNSDARFLAGSLDALQRAFEDPSVGIAGARRVFPDGTHQTSAASFPTVGSIVTGSFLLNEVFRRVFPNRRFPFELGLARRDHDRDRDVDWVSGTCLALRDECYEATGGFDETFHLYVEETDLCWRAWQQGWRVRFVAGATVEHHGGGSTGDPVLHARRFLRSEALFLTRVHGPSVIVRWQAARLAGSLAKTALLALPGLLDPRARARWRWHLSALRTVLGGTWREPEEA
jgi:N-acetylglucosaminyl-diphospho-decaprenol L-rhamnosyltransferase